MSLAKVFIIKEAIDTKITDVDAFGSGMPTPDQPADPSGFEPIPDEQSDDFTQQVWDYAQNRYGVKAERLNSANVETAIKNAKDKGLDPMEFVDGFFGGFDDGPSDEDLSGESDELRGGMTHADFLQGTSEFDEWNRKR